MKSDPLLLQAIKLLSQRLAILQPFYSKTSCMHPQERETLGYCYAYIEMFGTEDPLSTLLESLFIPALRKIGIAKWPRLELTDLGFGISNKDSEEVDIGSVTAPLLVEEAGETSDIDSPEVSTEQKV